MVLLSLSCSSTRILPKIPDIPLVSVKIVPEYNGIDDRAKSYYDEYVSLANLNGIYFMNKITIGFKDINEGPVIGLCTRNGVMGFREIDIDIGYWNRVNARQKMSLMYHELSHCMCGRFHDFGPNKFYPEPNKDPLLANKKDPIEESNDGFFEDGCPVSLMLPEDISPDCTTLHYPHYVKEMFDRCMVW